MPTSFFSQRMRFKGGCPTAANRNTYTRFRVAQHFRFQELIRTEVIHDPLEGGILPSGILATCLLVLKTVPKRVRT